MPRISQPLKSFLIGFILGIILVFVSTLGLVIGFVEFLQPLLSPGTELLRGRVDNFPINPLLLGLLLNGLIYGILLLLISFTKKLTTKSTRVTAIILLALFFLRNNGNVFKYHRPPFFT